MKIGIKDACCRGRFARDAISRNPTPIRRLAFEKSRMSLLLASVLLAGCTAFTRQAPIRQTFLLETPMPPAVARPQPGTLRVGTINVAAPFRGKTFVHRVSDLRFETDYYVEFLVAPATMLTEQTARALDHAKPFARVAGAGSGVDADWTLDGFASALYADLREAGKPMAELDIAYYLTPTAENEQTPVWTHQYQQRVPMRDASAAAYAEALNKAFANIVTELARDLSSAQLPKH
jgi:ABC-type uncharacterized transport system auxiliary subunit